MLTKLTIVLITLFGTYLCAEAGLFTCKYHGKIYDELDLFDGGVNGCAKCICVETSIHCDTRKCPFSSKLPSTTTTTSSINFEDDRNFNDPKQDVELVNVIDSEGTAYKPYQIGSGPVYRNRAGVFIHQLDDIDTQNQIQCRKGENC